MSLPLIPGLLLYDCKSGCNFCLVVFQSHRSRIRTFCVCDIGTERKQECSRCNEDLKAPRFGDNYREPTLQPSKGLNVKRYTLHSGKVLR